MSLDENAFSKIFIDQITGLGGAPNFTVNLLNSKYVPWARGLLEDMGYKVEGVGELSLNVLSGGAGNA